MSAMIFVVSLQMWRSSLFGQQSPAAPNWKSCATEEMKSAITDVICLVAAAVNVAPTQTAKQLLQNNENLPSKVID